MRSGEACWDLADENLSVVNGGQAVLFPGRPAPPHRQRRLHALPAPVDGVPRQGHRLRQRAAVPQARDRGAVRYRHAPGGAGRPARDLQPQPQRPLLAADRRAPDDRLGADHGRGALQDLFVGDRALGDLRQRPRLASAHSQLVRRRRRAPARERRRRGLRDRDERIADVARQLGYGKSRLYSLFTREVGMAPNDYRQRVRIKRCCEKLVRDQRLGHRRSASPAASAARSISRACSRSMSA